MKVTLKGKASYLVEIDNKIYEFNRGVEVELTKDEFAKIPDKDLFDIKEKDDRNDNDTRKSKN